MFDIALQEMLLVAVVALLVIGPKDLPKAMRAVGYWLSKARGVSRQFRAGFDTMVREAELADLEQKWKEENERIMREHPPEGAAATMSASDHTDAVDAHDPAPAVMVEKPVVMPAPEDAGAPPTSAHDAPVVDKAAS